MLFLSWNVQIKLSFMANYFSMIVTQNCIHFFWRKFFLSFNHLIFFMFKCFAVFFFDTKLCLRNRKHSKAAVDDVVTEHRFLTNIYLFKGNTDVVLVVLMLILNVFHTFFLVFYCFFTVFEQVNVSWGSIGLSV